PHLWRAVWTAENPCKSTAWKCLWTLVCSPPRLARPGGVDTEREWYHQRAGTRVDCGGPVGGSRRSAQGGAEHHDLSNVGRGLSRGRPRRRRVFDLRPERLHP